MNMITILAIVFCWFLVVEAIKGAVAHSRQKQAAKAEAALKREIDRLSRLEADDAERERIRQDVLRHNLEIVKIQKMERKLAEEQAKQAAVLEKHEKRIAALECKVRKLDRDITATNERICEYYGQLDWYILQQSGTANGGKEFRKWQDKIESTTDKIRKAENKVADMKDAKAMAEREMEAA